MLTVFGSAVLDTIRTPARTVRGVMGGAALYAGMSAGLFARTGLVAAVGTDFPSRHRRVLASRMDLGGLATIRGRTFRYECRYDKSLASRESLRVEMNVAAGFRPEIPEAYRRSGFVYLANNDPEQNLEALAGFDRVRFSMCDTIDYWIENKRDALVRLIRSVDALVVNEWEARMLAGEESLARCARHVMRRWGASYVVIKKAEHGALAFHGDEVFAAPGFLLERPVDPTGAGDAFAGALIGRMAAGNRATFAAMRKAMAYANAAGSFAVEGYGMGGLARAGRGEVEERVAEYARMTRP